MLALLITRWDGASDTFALSSEPVLIGRRPDCDLVLTESSVSGHHARITSLGQHALLVDLGSTNGTTVNGERVREASVKAGDRFRLGFQEIQVLAVKEGAQVGASGSKDPSGTIGRTPSGQTKTAQLPLETGARLVTLQGEKTGEVLSLNTPVWTLGKPGGPRLIFLLSAKGWSVTLLDGAAPLHINGHAVHHMPYRLESQDHIVYLGTALQFQQS